MEFTHVHDGITFKCSQEFRGDVDILTPDGVFTVPVTAIGSFAAEIIRHQLIQTIREADSADVFELMGKLIAER